MPLARVEDFKSNHTLRTEPLHQNFGIGGVEAQIDKDERFIIIKAIDPRQCLGSITSIKPLRQLMELFQQTEPRWRIYFFPPTTAVERSFVCPTSCAMMVGLKPFQVAGCTGACVGALKLLPGKRAHLATGGDAEKFALVTVLPKRAAFLVEILLGCTALSSTSTVT